VQDDDEVLGARLYSALRPGPADQPVDVQALLEGSHRRVRQVRHRRMAAVVAAGALVLAVPVGYEVTHPGASNIPQPAALIPSGTASGPVGGARSSPVRSPPGRTIPDSLAVTAAQLPPGLVPELDLTSVNLPTVAGQQCQSQDAVSARPLAGRQWTWTDGTGRTTALTVSLTVTRWPAGAGRQAFADLVEDRGFCRWTDPQTIRPFPMAADDSWASTSTVATLRYARSVVRDGDVIAGVEVQDSAGTRAAAALADGLATDVSQRLKASR
jgi:hypothetical protein